MKATFRRLQLLEKRHRDSAESGFDLYLLKRLAAARVRCGIPVPSPKSFGESRGMGIVAILHSGRRRAAEGREDTTSTSEPNCRTVLKPSALPYPDCE